MPTTLTRWDPLEEDITAGIAYGVLKITVPKTTAAEPRRIALGDR